MRDRLLVRHFLLRFLDHDLISPHADRREVLTITCAMVIVSSLFLSFFLAVKYQFNLFLPPGLTSILALDDRFFLFSLSMMAMGLVAVAEWDALALDARDTAILGPLPVSTAAIVRAKFAAVALFAMAFDIGLCLGPTVLRALALPVRLPISMAGVLRLTAAHAVCSLAAGAFGFLAVLGIRECCRATLGAAFFRRVSAALQAILVVLVLAALLLLPARYSQVGLRWMTEPPLSPAVVPPLWFVGLHEVLAGSVIDGLPRTAPPRRFAKAEHDASALYRSLWPEFRRLAAIAIAGLLSALFASAALGAWNHRRLPSETIGQSTRSGWLTRIVGLMARHSVVRSPVGQAGFVFTLQTLTRNASHRVTVAAAVAVAFALAVVIGSAAPPQGAIAFARLPLPVLAVQTLVLTVLLAAYRHLVRVPADPRATWIVQLAWSGQQWAYVAGSKCGALVLLAAPALFVLVIFGALLFDVRMAMAHAVVGGVTAVLILTVLCVTYHKLPFATAYSGAGDLKAIVPLCAVAALLASLVLAAIERAALVSATGEIALVAALVLAIIVTGVAQAKRQTPPMSFDAEELASGATQRFELSR